MNEIDEINESTTPVKGGYIARSDFSLTSTLSTVSSKWGMVEYSVMQSRTLCNLIAAHPSLQRTQILIAESYARRGSLSGQKFLILELHGFNSREPYLRLERRQWRQTFGSWLALNRGDRLINDLVRPSNYKMREELASYRS